VKRSRKRNSLWAGWVMVTALASWPVAGCRSRKQAPSGEPGTIAIDYPADGSFFPPEFPALLGSGGMRATRPNSWEINITFSDGSPANPGESLGEGMRIGESDPRCVSATNRPPALTPAQAAAHTWTPDAATWATISSIR